MKVGLGGRDPNLYCTFSHPDLDPPLIKLPLAPGGVTWTYNLKYNITDTYGGQVVQLLGVSVNDLTITGNFGSEDMWGWKKKNGAIDIAARFGETQRRWINDNPNVANGMVHLAEWFYKYFGIVSQGTNIKKGFERYNEHHMIFTYPARDWKIGIRPNEFPQVRFANDEIAPSWTVTGDFVETEETNRAFISDVTKIARDQLNELKTGIGFKRQNPFSEFLPNKINIAEYADQFIDNFQDTVLNFTDSDVEELIFQGFSRPPFPPLGG